ncbi:homocysteine S-methyltransferase family protein [Rubneribacter sp.]|nr:methionine synthase [Candidatus Rubneribacter avistercoris]
MPDISLRFHRDMLVLSAPVAAALARQGFDASLDLEYANMVEPEAVRDALRLNQIAGVQCLVANTAGITPARLAHRGLEERAPEVAGAALEAARQLAPQHLLAEVGPCGLPLDPSSKSSLNENRDQYARAARACAGQELDALFLNGFANPTDLKCALMGVRQVSDVAVFASVDVRADGLLADGRNPFDEALGVMADFGASVAGFATRAPLERAEAFARMAAGVGLLPVLAQLTVTEHAPRQGAATPENPYYCPDVLVDAGVRLRAAGAQFLRAAGKATPAYAGALVAASAGLDVVRPGAGA